MFRRSIKEINAEFIAEEKYLDSIQRIVKEACASAGLSRRDVSAVQLAIEEGATNVIRHAYLYEKGTLRVRIIIYKKMIVFSLIDSGRSFHPSQRGSIDLERLVESGRKGGLGFYMISKIMDSVEYISSAGFNELRMIRNIDRTEPGGTPPLLRRLFNLRVKFSLFTFFIVIVIIGSTFYFLNRSTTEEVRGHLEDIVTALGTTIADQAAGYIINSRSDVEFDELIVSYTRSNPFLSLVVLTDTADVIRAHSRDISNIRKKYSPPIEIDPGLTGVHQRHIGSSEEVNYIILPITTGERLLGEVHLKYSSAPVDAKMAQVRRRILIFAGAMLLVGILGIYLLSNYFVKPIAKITQRVRRFTLGDLETELPLEGADEFFEIAHALNDMITRLSRDRKNVIEKERMAKEIEVASQIQKTLLPSRLPSVPGLEMDTFYRAASVVGGDLYDVFDIGEGRYCLVVADVSGKGVPASLVMSMLRTVIQIYAIDAKSSKDILLSVNGYLQDNIPPGMFITVQLGIYDTANRRLNFVSAGHNPMLYYRAGTKQLVPINPAGMPLGVPVTLSRSFEQGLEEISLTLDTDDLFFLYTDGITEATDREGEQYGVAKLQDFLQQRLGSRDGPEITAISRDIVEEIDNFSGFAKQNDDITFILARTVPQRQGQGKSDREVDQDGIDSRTIAAGPDDPDPGVRE